jgi:hypothetical protein
MDETDPGLGEKLLFRVAKNIGPRQIHSAEVSVESGHTDEVEGEIE